MKTYPQNPTDIQNPQQLSNFSQIQNAAETLQMTMNPYLMGGSSKTSNKPLMVFTGTDPEYSVEDYLNAVTVKFNFKHWT